MNIDNLQRNQHVQILDQDIRAQINGGKLSRTQLLDSLVSLRLKGAGSQGQGNDDNDDDVLEDHPFNDCIGTLRNDCIGVCGGN